jgi:hypothetical protein
MSLKMGLIEGDILDRHSPLPWLMLQDAIHQRERIAMGQQSLNLFRVQQRRRG